MIILSSDHDSNLPGARRNPQGGLTVFARMFSEWVLQQGHTWVGVVADARHDNIPLGWRMKSISRHKAFAKASYSRRYKTGITKAKKNTDLRRLLEPVITLFYTNIKKINPDILFLNGYTFYSWILLEAARRAGIPIVAQHAGILKKEVDMYPEYFTSTGREMLYEIERDVSRYAAHEVFLNTKSWGVYSKEVMRVSRRKASVIPLPCKSLDYHKKEIRKKEGYDIGIVARWDRIKNHEAFLAVAKKAHAEKLPWRFHAVTHIPETKVKKRFKKAYRKHIIIHDSKGESVLRGFYRDMDLMVLLSHFDTSPFVVIEAAMEGTGTLISPNVGHVTEYRAAGAGKWIIDPSDASRVLRRMKQLIGKPVPPALAQTFRRLHDPEKVFSQYLKLFQRIVKENKSHRI